MIPAKYQWAASLKAPKQIVEAFRHYGELEKKGSGNNPEIIRWAREVGGKVADVYKADSIPWCGLFAALVIQRSRGAREVVKDPLWALNWGTYGVKSDKPMFGDVLVFVRNGGGHVGFYIAEDDECFHVLGGNTSDSVSISRIAKSRLYQARRPDYKIGQPKEVKKYFMQAAGAVTTNEA
jgi:uncharacterized protein (TIGR02594 family)